MEFIINVTQQIPAFGKLRIERDNFGRLTQRPIVIPGEIERSGQIGLEEGVRRVESNCLAHFVNGFTEFMRAKSVQTKPEELVHPCIVRGESDCRSELMLRPNPVPLAVEQKTTQDP